MSAAALVLRGLERPATRRPPGVTTGIVAALGTAVAVAPSGPLAAIAVALAVATGLWLSGRAGWPTASAMRALAALWALVVAANAVFLAGRPLSVLGVQLPASHEGLLLGLWTALRLPGLLLLFRAWFLTVEPNALAGAVTRLARRLGAGAEAALAAGLALQLALRSLPVLGREAERLSLQRALRRGWPGPELSPRERARRLRLRWRDLPAVVVPLVLLGLARGERVALALAARHAGAATPSPLAARPAGAGERLALAGSVLALAGAAAARLWIS